MSDDVGKRARSESFRDFKFPFENLEPGNLVLLEDDTSIVSSMRRRYHRCDSVAQLAPHFLGTQSAQHFWLIDASGIPCSFWVTTRGAFQGEWASE
jgi:hypothetical protein